MAKGTVAVTFQPHNVTTEIAKGTTLRDAAGQAGLPIDTPCGGQGTCGKCRVRVANNSVSVTDAEIEALSARELDTGYRLACQFAVNESIIVEVPETSLLAADYQILTESQVESPDSLDPPVTKRFIELPTPTLEDDVPDLERLVRVLGPLDTDRQVLQTLPGRLRDAGFAGTAVLAGNRLVAFESGNTEQANYAVAFDLGTTTLVGTLIDVATGAECANVARMNPQTRYGDDVLSRILHAREQTKGLNDLQDDVVGSVNAMIDELVEAREVDSAQIYQATFSGNTTMQLLFAGIDPSPLGEMPFVPAVKQGLCERASAFGLHIHPLGDVYVYPVIGGFVGGDTVSGILVTGLAESDKPTLFTDIGTNGEIVLAANGKIEAASTAAGPAFEGARISCGMRAAVGAIEKIDLSADGVQYEVIGDAAPMGICGSALIDVAAGLLRHGIVGMEGLMLSPDTLPEDLPAALRERVVIGEDGPEFVVAPANEAQTDKPIAVSHRDIRELQLATAAIRAGIAILLRRADLGPGDLDRFLVAGGFGNYIRPENAQRLGLLPETVDPERFAFVGNTSLAGAKQAALSRGARVRAEAIARQVRHVELSLDVNFQMEYVEAMMFPEGIESRG